jgi:hypothetical protein
MAIPAIDLFEEFDPLDYLQPDCPCTPSAVRQVRLLVFDEYITTAALTYTTSSPSIFDSLLAAFDQVAIEAVVDECNSPAMKITIAIQHSADGVNWVTKATLLPATSLASGATTVLPTEYDDGTIPTLGFARFFVTLSGDVVPKQAHVRITASLVDSRWRHLDDLDQASARIIADLYEGRGSLRAVGRPSG